MNRKKRTRFDGQWVGHRAEMRQSPAWSVLSNNALRLLLRLELEHMQHGGAENASLACTYSDFQLAGIRRQSVAGAIRECAALGFLEVTLQGYRAASGFAQPSLYRLTYLNGAGKSPPATDDWRAISSVEHASEVVRKAEDAAKRKRAAAHTRRQNAALQPIYR